MCIPVSLCGPVRMQLLSIVLFIAGVVLAWAKLGGDGMSDVQGAMDAHSAFGIILTILVSLQVRLGRIHTHARAHTHTHARTHTITAYRWLQTALQTNLQARHIQAEHAALACKQLSV